MPSVRALWLALALLLLFGRGAWALEPRETRQLMESLLGPQSPLALLGTLESQGVGIELSGERARVTLDGLGLIGGEPLETGLQVDLVREDADTLRVELLNWPRQLVFEQGSTLRWGALDWDARWSETEQGWEALNMRLASLDIRDTELRVQAQELRVEAVTRGGVHEVTLTLNGGRVRSSGGGMQFNETLDQLSVSARLPVSQGSLADLYALTTQLLQFVPGRSEPPTALVDARAPLSDVSGLSFEVRLDGFSGNNPGRGLESALDSASMSLRVDQASAGLTELNFATQLRGLSLGAMDRSLTLLVDGLDLGLDLVSQESGAFADLLTDFGAFEPLEALGGLSAFRFDAGAASASLRGIVPEGLGASGGPLDAELGLARFLFTVQPTVGGARELLLDVSAREVSAQALPDLGDFNALASAVVPPLLPEEMALRFKLPDISEALWQALVTADGAVLSRALGDLPPLVLDGTLYRAEALDVALDGQVALNPAAPLDVEGEIAVRTRNIPLTIATLQQGALAPDQTLAQAFVTAALGLQFVSNFGLPQEDGSSLFRLSFPADSAPLLNDAPLPNLPF